MLLILKKILIDLKHKEKFDVEVQNVSNQYGQLAIQGPKARDLINQLVDEDVTEMKMFEFKQDVKLFGAKRHFISVRLHR